MDFIEHVLTGELYLHLLDVGVCGGDEVAYGGSGEGGGGGADVEPQTSAWIHSQTTENCSYNRRQHT